MTSPLQNLVSATRLIEEACAQLFAKEERESLAVESARRVERIHQGMAPSGRRVCRLDDLIEGNERFGTIYADPPWQYENAGSRGAAENHYRTMAVDAIAGLPVACLAAADAHLHL